MWANVEHKQNANKPTTSAEWHQWMHPANYRGGPKPGTKERQHWIRNDQIKYDGMPELWDIEYDSDKILEFINHFAHHFAKTQWAGPTYECQEIAANAISHVQIELINQLNIWRIWQAVEHDDLPPQALAVALLRGKVGKRSKRERITEILNAIKLLQTIRKQGGAKARRTHGYQIASNPNPCHPNEVAFAIAWNNIAATPIAKATAGDQPHWRRYTTAPLTREKIIIAIKKSMWAYTIGAENLDDIGRPTGADFACMRELAAARKQYKKEHGTYPRGEKLTEIAQRIYESIPTAKQRADHEAGIQPFTPTWQWVTKPIPTKRPNARFYQRRIEEEHNPNHDYEQTWNQPAYDDTATTVGDLTIFDYGSVIGTVAGIERGERLRKKAVPTIAVEAVNQTVADLLQAAGAGEQPTIWLAANAYLDSTNGANLDDFPILAAVLGCFTPKSRERLGKNVIYLLASGPGPAKKFVDHMRRHILARIEEPEPARLGPTVHTRTWTPPALPGEDTLF